MATPANFPKPDLSALRIDDRLRSQSKMGKRIFYASIPVLIFAGIVAAAYAFRNQRPMVEVATAAKPDPDGRQTLLNASGYVTPRRRATIAAKITGRVTAVYFDEGTHVREGQLLATLDDSDVRRALEAAKADRNSAQAAIADGGGFTRTGIATIVDMKSNEFEVDVNESFIARVEPRQDVKAILDAYPEREIPSKVRTIIPSADRQKATVKVRISIPNLEKYNFILPDMSVKVSFEGPPQSAPAKGPEALAYIPKSAIRTGAGASFVFRVKDGKVERRAISVGMDRGTDVAILAGVTPGDSLVVKGPESLRDGDKVEIRQ